MDVELVLSTVLAIATVCYTIINLMMWVESRATRKQKIMPNVIAYLKTTEDHLTLCVHIKNIGEGCAKNVKVRILKDYNQFRNEKFSLSNLMFFKNGANIFPPQYELRFYIDSLEKIDYNSNSSYIELEISYNDIDNKYYKERFRLPFNQIVGTNYSEPPETYMGQIPYYLKEISKLIKNLSKLCQPNPKT